ncbi:hypothetical protein KO494_11465 [Lacinutrix sp. C3R15]|uniref:hypothetical protein n=1 Tax=Flavobacteriaceae TaxID=49546 RepID=UPI001C08BAF4|nr:MULTISPECIES: hypothetical protein [Flavobacteriaceae]MBU2940154.1 hypothetical protein [Lacinutrix sp. C3R15]MDO6623471.1 hypothetical protein [Oceanihabitans sp. 1_MG-2023]
MVTLIIIVVVLIFGKFIYDSYLTDNTEKRWEEYKESDPMGAAKVENSRFGAKPIKQDLELKKQLNKQKKQLVIESIKEELTIYQINNLKEIEEKHGTIRGNMMATLEATDIITSNTEHFKEEFLPKKEELELSEQELITIIEDVARDVIKEKIGIELGMSNLGYEQQLKQIEEEDEEEENDELDKLLDLEFNELTKMFYETVELNKSNYDNRLRSKIINIQEAIEYHTLAFENELSKLENLLFEANDENFQKYREIRGDNLMNLSKYNKNYDVEGALCTNSINSMLDKLGSLDKLFNSRLN